MKIAVTATTPDLDGPVDPRFGRAPWFVIYDLESDEHEPVENAQSVNLPQGAGIQAARHIVEAGAGALLTGHCGPNAFRTLNAGKVAVHSGVEGTVREAIARFRDGKLGEADAPDVEGHW